MANAINIALTEIEFRIPPEILNYVFTDRLPHEATYSPSEMLLNRVIRTKVFDDMNLSGGRPTNIPLLESYIEKLTFDTADRYQHTGPFSIFRIPPEIRENEPIIAVNALTYWGNYSGQVPHLAGHNQGATFTTAGAAVLQSHTGSGSPPKPNIEIMSGDLIKLYPTQHNFIPWQLNCRIGYDKDFTNLNSDAITIFKQLCLEASKMYIYNKVVIRLDKGQIDAGYELGEVKRIIDSYAEAPARYDELLPRMQAAMSYDVGRLYTALAYLI